MRSSHVTIKDIARELGVSPSTISRALKDHPDISPETKKAVTDLAKKLNYQPNILAQNLRKSKTNTIGIIVPEIAHFFFSTVISGIEDIAYAAGYNVIIAQSKESHEREVTDIQALFNSRVDGLLVSIARNTKKFDHFDDLIRKEFPLVFFDRVHNDALTSKVIVDDEQGAYEATTHLISLGHQRIAHLAGPQNLLIGINRLAGYKKALSENNLSIDENLIKICDKGTYEEAEEITKTLLASHNPPDAIFANNDVAAYGSMKAIKDKGLKIPTDVAIVGFSNWLFSELIEPALSTVTQPGFKMGQEAAKLLIKQIELGKNEAFTPKTITLKTDLIIRESSKGK